jgi:outer membrane protein OmpA-like peptidoglycan-associated protein
MPARQPFDTRKTCCLAAVLLASPVVIAALAGCAGPNAQVQRVQNEKEELLATIRQQRDANRGLQNQLVSLEQRLDQAETQLAGGTPRQLSSYPRPSTLGSSFANNSNAKTANAPVQPGAGGAASPPLLATTARSPRSLQAGANAAATAPGSNEAPLNWRPHRASQQPAAALPGLAQLARQDDRVEVDAETGAGVWTEGVAFEQNTSVLTPESRQQLAELAKLLQRSPASKFRVLVATAAERTGSRSREGMAKSGRQLATARAQSVADYLDRHGIAEDRLAISSTGVRKTARSEHGLPENGVDDVRIYLVDPDQTVLGWLQNDTIRR